MAHVLRKNNSIGEELRKYLKQIFGIMTTDAAGTGIWNSGNDPYRTGE